MSESGFVDNPGKEATLKSETLGGISALSRGFYFGIPVGFATYVKSPLQSAEGFLLAGLKLSNSRQLI